MVVYSGTSNWSENYFTNTAGVGLVVNQTGSEVKKGQETLQSQAEELFLKDWTSQYASTLPVDDVDVCPRGPHWVLVVQQSTLHYTCALCLLLSLELYFTYSESAAWTLLIYWFFDLLTFFFVHSCVFIFRFKRVIFVLCIVDNCLTWVKTQGNLVCTIYFMPGAFCIFSWWQAFSNLTQEIKHFPKWCTHHGHVNTAEVISC